MTSRSCGAQSVSLFLLCHSQHLASILGVPRCLLSLQSLRPHSRQQEGRNRVKQRGLSPVISSSFQRTFPEILCEFLLFQWPYLSHMAILSRKQNLELDISLPQEYRACEQRVMEETAGRPCHGTILWHLSYLQSADDWEQWRFESEKTLVSSGLSFV